MKNQVLIITALIGLGLMSFMSIDSITATHLQGKVTDENTGDPILIGTVALFQNGTLITGTETDFDGNYFFGYISSGSYEVEVSYLGYSTKRIKDVKVKEGEVNILDVKIGEGVQLESVKIVGCKVPRTRACKTTHRGKIVKTEKLKERRKINKKSEEISDAIRNLTSRSSNEIAATSAGVTRNKDGEISVRGSRSDATFYYIDGVRVKSENATNMIPQAQFSKEVKTTEHEIAISDRYSKPTENAFISPVTQSFSTFSLDVDKAAYSNVRQYLNSGRLPPVDAVRVEEMINYFEYDYKTPKGDKHPFAIYPTYTSCPWNSVHRLLHLGVKAKEVSIDKLPASNIVFLIDVSGSMGSSNKLPLVKKSFKLLLDKLRPEDRVAIVTYAGHSGVPLPSTPASQKKAILAGLENLRSGGGTAGAKGIVTAYEIATKHFIKGGNNRVILATDGDFNIGISGTKELEKLIEKKRQSGVFLSVLGYGVGNYQDHKMQSLSSKGNGNHAYIDNISEAKKVLVNEFGGTLFTVAKDVKIQIEFNPAYVNSYRLVGYENRMLAKEDFNDDTKDAGEVGTGHTVTAIYEIIPAGVESSFEVALSEDELLKSRSAKQAQMNEDLAYIKCRYKHPDGKKSIKFNNTISTKVQQMKEVGKDVQFSIAVAEFGLNIGQSSYLKSKDLSDCILRATLSKGKDKHGYRQEFIELITGVKNSPLAAQL